MPMLMGHFASCVCVHPLMLTWWYFADSGRMPAIALVAVGTLDKDSTVAETLCKHLSPNVVQPHAPPWKRKRGGFSLSQQLPADYVKHKCKRPFR